MTGLLDGVGFLLFFLLFALGHRLTDFLPYAFKQLGIVFQFHVVLSFLADQVWLVAFPLWRHQYGKWSKVTCSVEPNKTKNMMKISSMNARYLHFFKLMKVILRAYPQQQIATSKYTLASS